MTPSRYRLLTELLTQPTAPFREEHVVRLVTRVLTTARVPHFLDPIGNIVIGCENAPAYRRLLRQATPEPLRVFIAHMDHPGFHGVRWRAPDRLSIRWHGGSPTKHVTGSRVWLASATGYIGHGRLQNVRLHPAGYSIGSAEVKLERDAHVHRSVKAASLYGGFAFRAPVWRAGKRLYSKAADDLVGVYAVLATALDGFRAHRAAPPFLGLLTRAEEVGFVGAIGHFELGWIDGKRDVMCVSLETSRTLSNALIGRGPVVRLGDRRTVFDHGGIHLLSELARETLPGQHQRRIMDGGTCEATAAIAYGLRAIGLSVPLGNYHNQGFEGGPDCRGAHGPAPEFVHLDDIDGLTTLCRALVRPGLKWDRPWAAQRRVFRARFRAHRALLRLRT